MKKPLILLFLLLLSIGGFFAYKSASKIAPFYSQLTQNRVGTETDLQEKEQKNAHFVGSSKCIGCHADNHKS
ncbi:MAG: hypothetical protein Q9M32_06005 [Sulfurimonas sp.]|nr:hypothetical protein [Sulfurimonas sp.]MDQ7060561.1 hypothetical protein [Sulfurimonas sp.]